MSDSILNIIINTVKRGGGDKEAVNNLVKMKTQFKEMTGINLSSLTAWAAVGAAVAKVVDLTKKAIDKNVKYVSSIVDISKVTKESLEDTSRLAQVSDDAFLSIESLTKALIAAKRKGYDVSTEGLKKLSDQYIATGKDAKFLTDVFGKSGAEMYKLMEKTGAGIEKEMATISKTLLVTEKSMKITYEYKESVDALNDAFGGTDYTLAQKVMPELTDLNIILAAIVESLNSVEVESKGGKFLEYIVATITGFAGAGGGFVSGLSAWADAVDKIDPALRGFNVELGKTGGAAEDAGEELFTAASYMKELTTEMLFNQAAAGLDQEATLALMAAMGLLNIETYNAMGAVNSLKGALDAGYITMQNYIAMMGQIAAGPQYGGSWSTPNSPVNGGGGGGGGGGSSSGSWNLMGTMNGPGTPNAWWNGSSWYYGDHPPGAAKGGLVKVGERGTEIVKLPDGAFVYNHEQTQQMLGGSNVTNYIYVNGAGDPSKVADEVVRKLELNGMRRRS